MNPAPKVFLILAGVAVGLCLAPAVLITAVNQGGPPSQVDQTTTPAQSAGNAVVPTLTTRSSAAASPSAAVSPTAQPEPPAPADPPPVEKTTVAPQPQCHPSYEGACVPFAEDVDCEGGSGNGPAYVRGPVKVVGPDVYDLDRDGDGWGCED